MKYRPEIDGIRMIAIFCVLLFHLKVYGFRGGFIGVDVFYVVSGYLVSGQILTRLQNGSFKFLEFYAARAKRLFPALFTTVALTFLAASVLMLPADFERFSLSAVAALVSLSNVTFFLEAGYWDTASDYKPLLHTWSLGVEEQFYLAWPLLIFVIHKSFKGRNWTSMLVVLTVVGILVSEWMVRVDESAAFYLSPFRIFQFSAGALAFRMAESEIVVQKVLRLQSIRWMLFVGGGLVILLASVEYSAATQFPGIAALVPTVGTMALLLAGADDQDGQFLGNRILALPPAVWIGKISYALYLVHWPLISFYMYLHGVHGGLNISGQVGLLVATFFAASLLHYGVERRFYQRSGEISERKYSDKKTLLGLGLAFLVLFSFGIHAWSTQGWKWRFPNMKYTPADIREGELERFSLVKQQDCSLTSFLHSDQCLNSSNRRILVLGNSLAPDAYNFLWGGFRNRSDYTLMTADGFRECGFKMHEENGRWKSSLPHCQQKLNALFNPSFLSRLQTIVFAHPRPMHAIAMPYVRLLHSLKDAKPDLDIVVFGPYLMLKRECSYHLGKHNSAAQCVANDNVNLKGLDGNPRLVELLDEFNQLNFRYIDRVGLLCKGDHTESCAYESISGDPLYWDTRHATLGFSVWAGELFASKSPNFFDQTSTR